MSFISKIGGISKSTVRWHRRKVIHLEDRVRTYTWLQKALLVVACALSLDLIASLFNSYIKSGLDKLSLIFVVVAFVFAVVTIWQNIEVFKSFESAIGLKHYVIEAANRYENAKQSVQGVLGHWQVNRSLEYALTHSSCPKMTFLGEIGLDPTLPGVLWRLHLNDERRKNGLEPMNIAGISKTSMRFIVIDENNVLHERTIGGRFSGSVQDNVPDLAKAYVKVFDELYPPGERKDAKELVLELVMDFIVQRVKEDKIQVEKVEELIAEKVLFESGPYGETLGEKEFFRLLEECIDDLHARHSGVFDIISEDGHSVLKIMDRRGR